MAKKDWTQIIEKFERRKPRFFEEFIRSDECFYPSKKLENIFNEGKELIYAKDLEKDKPGNWIPIYDRKDLPDFFVDNGIYPIRSGQAAFFFYKGEVFFDLTSIDFEEIEKKDVRPIENFVPESLKVKFQRNENAYLNKAIALGMVNHFVDIYEPFKIFETQIATKKYSRLLYGQFGKIKLTTPLSFLTSRGSKTIEPGFQFEIDLVLENRADLFIIEAKCGTKERDNFSLLQLYYPYVYFKSTIEKKNIRTIFIDIVETDDGEYYKFLEIEFENDMFDRVQPIKGCKYR